MAENDALNYFLGNHAYSNTTGPDLTKEAFAESERLAKERIPQLKKAIDLLKSSPQSWDIVLTDAIESTEGSIKPYDKILKYLSKHHEVRESVAT